MRLRLALSAIPYVCRSCLQAAWREIARSAKRMPKNGKPEPCSARCSRDWVWGCFPPARVYLGLPSRTSASWAPGVARAVLIWPETVAAAIPACAPEGLPVPYGQTIVERAAGSPGNRFYWSGRLFQAPGSHSLSCCAPSNAPAGLPYRALCCRRPPTIHGSTSKRGSRRPQCFPQLFAAAPAGRITRHH